jgi:alpha-tubulin suppressor-like RCC1 family protein
LRPVKRRRTEVTRLVALATAAACGVGGASCGASTGVDLEFPIDDAAAVATRVSIGASPDASFNDAADGAASDALLDDGPVATPPTPPLDADGTTGGEMDGDDEGAPSSETPAAIAAGFEATCEVTTVGAAWCWGDNSYGELGNGGATPMSLTPVAVSGLASGVRSITVGGAFACALKTAGAVVCWGNNEFASGAEIDSNTPVAIAGLSTGITSIIAGYGHACAIDADGGVKCWGANSFGQLGDGSTTNSKAPATVSGLSSGVVAIAAGSDFTCALTSAGQVLCWGDNAEGQLANGSTVSSDEPVAIASLPMDVVAIVAGGSHACALTSSGLMPCWGAQVQQAITGLSSGVAAMAAGQDHTCALMTSGAVECWGSNEFGQLGNDSTINSDPPVSVSGLSSGVAFIAAGNYDTCALTVAGAALCWGENDDGQLGDNSTTTSLVPVSVVAP